MGVLRRLPWDGLTSLCLHRAGATSQLGNGEAGGLHGGASLGVPELGDCRGGKEQYGGVIGDTQPKVEQSGGGADSEPRGEGSQNHVCHPTGL